MKTKQLINEWGNKLHATRFLLSSLYSFICLLLFWMKMPVNESNEKKKVDGWVLMRAHELPALLLLLDSYIHRVIFGSLVQVGVRFAVCVCVCWWRDWSMNAAHQQLIDCAARYMTLPAVSFLSHSPSYKHTERYTRTHARTHAENG